ncbi:MAG: DUF1559 domain-containing protein, partial [Planctomycetota bacterium]
MPRVTMFLMVGGAVGLLAGCGGGVTQDDMRRHAIQRRDNNEANSDTPAATNANKREKKKARDTQPSAAAQADSNTSRSAKNDSSSSKQPTTHSADDTAGEKDAAISATTPGKPSKPLDLVGRRQRTIDNLAEIGKAISRYCEENGHLFAPAIRHSRGQPILSWRVELLPYLGHEDLYQKFDHKQAWDSEPNKRLLSLIPDVYQSPERFDERTNYVIPIGSFTAFNRPQRGVPVRKIEDGLENTVVLLEADDTAAVPWTKPEDLTINLTTFDTHVGSLRSDGFFVVWGNGTVTRVTSERNEPDLKAIFTFDAHDMFISETVRAAATATPAPVHAKRAADSSTQPASDPEIVAEWPGERPGDAPTKPVTSRATTRRAETDTGDEMRDPKPGTRSLERARVLVREIYEDHYKNSKTRDERHRLSRRMLSHVPEMADDPAGQYVLLQIVIDIAVQIGDAATAIDAMEQVSARFDISTLERLKLEHRVLGQLGDRRNRSQATNQALLDRTGPLIQKALEVEEFDTAESFCRLALSAARQLDLKREAAKLQREQKTIQEAKKAYDTVRRTVKTLECNDDPRANYQVGRYYCLIRRDWHKGLPLLAKGSH